MVLRTIRGNVNKYNPVICDKNLASSRAYPQRKLLLIWLLLILTLVILSAVILYFPLLSADTLTLFTLRKSVTRASIYSKAQEQNNGYYKLLDIQQQQMGKNKDDEKVVSCYYDTPNNQDNNQLMPSDIHAHLCTHINVAFARVVNKSISLDEQQYKVLSQVVKLKNKNPKLKVMLSVGGAGNDNGFSEMVVDHASRKIFIKSIKYILRNYSLDGIDLDWEFPAVHNSQYKLEKRERQHFSQLLHEIRSEYIREKRDYLLTVAVAAPETLVDVCYDVDQLNMYTDFVNIMTYDFHYFTKFTPFTGLNSPLYARPTEQMYMATLNINYTVNMYINKGLDREKIVVGIPTYGHSFTLVNADNTRVGSPASSYGTLGGLGFVNYPDICTYINKHNTVKIKQDENAKVPYLYNGKEWVSYDTPKSVMEKAKYIKDNQLRGAMIYSLNADDYGGVCGSEGDSLKFPLSQSVKNVLLEYD
ncbi:chitinase-3-like protein 1 [Galleria mellonella]|uniref:Chitinase-3-like protein 1 n=1 Tax=Galleria mellonella TaxID=7137 RepID=A0A6J1WEZ3_GALME|nr:chitinase-3-like protein 1 [Galleria mellonella]